MKQTQMTTSATDARSPRPGFTFVEIILVIAIMGILIGVALPRMQRTLGAARLQSYAQEICTLARRLQGEAIVRSRAYCLVFDKEQNTFQARLPAGGRLQDVPGRLGRAWGVRDGISVRIEPQDSLETFFYPDGSTDPVKIFFTDTYGDDITLWLQGASGQIQAF